MSTELEIEEVVSLDEYVESSRTTYYPLLENIVARHISSEQRNDVVAAVYVKTPSAEMSNAIKDIPDIFTDKTKLQEIYVREAALLGLETRTDFTTVPDANIREWLSHMVNGLEIRPFPQLNEEYRIMSRMELSLEARNDFINRVTSSVNVSNFLGTLGVSKDYKPSAEVLEIACLSAALFISYVQANQPSQNNNGKIIRPGELYRP